MTGEAHEHSDSSKTELGFACTDYETSVDDAYVVGVIFINQAPYFFLLFNGAVSF
jgi:hypothetical protein